MGAFAVPSGAHEPNARVNLDQPVLLVALTLNEDEEAMAAIVDNEDIEHAISETISDLGSSLPIASYLIELDLPTPRYRTIRVRADHPEGDDDVGIQIKAV